MEALRVENLEKTYPGGVRALKGVSLRVAQGDFFALLGPNGAGKSTFISILTSMVRKTTGRVEIFGVDIDDNFALAKTYLGIVPQEYNFNIFETPREILINQAGYYGIAKSQAIPRAERYLQQLELWDKQHVQIRNLSGGMKRRLMIARALMNEPKLLILDEPTAGVDIEIRRSMWQFLRDINIQGTTIILTTHYLEEAESLCRNIAIIDRGLLVKHSSLKHLLQQLNQETFVLNVQNPIAADLQLANIPLRYIDETTLEVDVLKEDSLNQVFEALSAANVQVLSMRNKSNRLEELFLRLVQHDPPVAS